MGYSKHSGQRGIFRMLLNIITSAALFGVLGILPAASFADTFQATLVRITTGSLQGSSDAATLTGVDYELDTDTETVTQLSAETHAIFDLNPLPGNNLFEYKFSGVIFDIGSVAISGTAYECVEGQFGGAVAASLCGNYTWGGNFIDESSTDYSTIPGTKTIGGDDFDIGPQQQLADFASDLASLDETTLIIETPSWTASPGGAGLQLEFLITGGGGPNLLDVPDVTGQSQAAAEATIVGASLLVGNISQALHNTVPAGIVISQNPEACVECALENSAVDILVSLGPPMPGQAPALLGELIDAVNALGLPKGLTNALTEKLENALGQLTDGNEQAAFNLLQAFMNQVAAQSGNKIPADDADDLIAGAEAVIQAVQETCNGFAPTIVGTEDDDDINGTSGIDVISGMGGGDRILGFDGDDIICGGEGDDDLLGGGGADQLFGDAGNDVMEGNANDDVCDGVTGVDSASLDCEVHENVDTHVFPVTLFANDGVQLDGALYVPTGDALAPGGKYRKLAMIVSHGAMGSFDSSMPKVMGLQAAPLGFTVLALNRRDWGPTGGGGAVLFEDATTDLGVGISLLNSLGYDAIYVAGHSQGTNNAAIYPSFVMDPTVAAVGLYGTVDDGRDTARTLLFDSNLVDPGYDENVIHAEELVSLGQGDDVIPWLTVFGQNLFRSPANFLSYWGPDSLSVVVEEITKLEVPALLMRANGDEFTPDAMSQNVMDAALAAGVDATYTILDYPHDLGFLGVNAHGFVAVEREMMAETLGWLTDHVPEASQYTKNIDVPNGE